MRYCLNYTIKNTVCKHFLINFTFPGIILYEERFGAGKFSGRNILKKGLTNVFLCDIIIKRSKTEYRGVEQVVARRAHNPKVVSSSLASATIKKPLNQ